VGSGVSVGVAVCATAGVKVIYGVRIACVSSELFPKRTHPVNKKINSELMDRKIAGYLFIIDYYNCLNYRIDL
jgi:hypothetical protein